MADSDYQLVASRSAFDDLDACKTADPKASAAIVVFLRELRDSKRDLGSVIDERYEDETVESVVPIWSLQEIRVNAYRVKLVLYKGWRLIFAVDHSTARVGFFGLMPRDEDYSAEYLARIEREHDELGFRRY